MQLCHRIERDGKAGERLCRNPLQGDSLSNRFFSTIQVIMRQNMIQGFNMNSVGVQPADFVIAPDVTSFDISEFTRADEMARYRGNDNQCKHCKAAQDAQQA